MSAKKTAPELPAYLEELFEFPADRFTLPNGLVVIHKQLVNSKLISVQSWIKAGSIHEGERLGSGLSHFLEHMLFKGTEKRTATDISRDIILKGGHINAYTSFDRTVYYVDVPAEAIETALDVLADVSFCSTLPEEEFRREQGVILREIDMSQDDPDRTVSRALFRNAFRNLPFRHPVLGYRKAFESLTCEDLKAYYQSRYVPNNSVLVVTGDITREKLEELLVNTAFFTSPSRKLPASYFMDEPVQLAMREEHLYDDVHICRGSMGFKIPRLTDESAPALDLLASILGNGSSSILSKKLRDEKKIVHHIDSTTWNPAQPGLLWISYLCDPNKRDEVQMQILETLDETADKGIAQIRLETAINQAAASEVNLTRTISGQASRLGQSEVVVGDLNYPYQYFKRLFSITTETITELAGRYLVAGGMTSVSLNALEARPAATKAKTYPEPEDFTLTELDNGVKMIHQHDATLPKIHIRAVCLGGPLYEDPEKRGITGVMATLLTKDTQGRSAAEVAEAIDGCGGAFSEHVGNNSFGLAIEVLSKDFELALELMDDALLNPEFQQDTFEIERDAQIAQVKEDMDEIVEFGRKRLRQLFFGDHPFSIDPYGTEGTLQSLSLGDLKGYRERQVVGGNTVVALTGNFDKDKGLEELEWTLSSMSDWAFMKKNEPFQGPAAPGRHEEKLPREQTLVMVGYPDAGIAEGNELFRAGEILEEIFSEMSGRLFTRIREEKGLAYYTGANRISGIHTGMFYFYAGTEESSAEEVLTEILAEAERAAAGNITQEELDRAKQRLIALKRMSMQTIGSRAMQATLNVLYDQDVNEWKQYDSKIAAITLDHLKDFAKERFEASRSVQLIIKP